VVSPNVLQVDPTATAHPADLVPVTRATQATALLRQAHSLYHTLGAPEAIEIQTMLSTLDEDSSQPPDQPAPES
jgi:hypothetical protein